MTRWIFDVDSPDQGEDSKSVRLKLRLMIDRLFKREDIDIREQIQDLILDNYLFMGYYYGFAATEKNKILEDLIKRKYSLKKKACTIMDIIRGKKDKAIIKYYQQGMKILKSEIKGVKEDIEMINDYQSRKTRLRVTIKSIVMRTSQDKTDKAISEIFKEITPKT